MKLKKAFLILLLFITIVGLIFVIRTKMVGASDEEIPETIRCDFCFKVAQRNSIVLTKAPTCEEDGIKTVSYVCSENHTSTRKYKVDALGHNWGEPEIKEATCEELESSRVECERCHLVLEQSFGELAPHEYVDGVCINCGAIKPECSEEEDVHIHRYSQATCQQKPVCTYCGEEEPGSQLADHDFVEKEGYVIGGKLHDYKECSWCGGKVLIHHELADELLYDEELDHYYNECSICGRSVFVHTYNEEDVFYDEELEHDAAICTKCGAKALVHSYSEIDGKCEQCGLTKDEVFNIENGSMEVMGADEPTFDSIDNIATDGGAISASYENGVLTISGHGKMKNFEKGKTPWNNVRGDITSIRIEADSQDEPITHIGTYAFYYCTQLTDITITYPDQIKSIGEGAFFGCKSLRSFRFSKNLEAIGARAFCHCHELTSIDLSENTKLVRIGHEAFRDCWLLDTVLLPEGVKVLGYEAFFNCISLNKVFLPSTIKCLGTIGDQTDLEYANNSENEPRIGTEDQVTSEVKDSDNTSGYNNVFTIDLARNIKNKNAETTSKVIAELKEYLTLICIKNKIIAETNSINLVANSDNSKITVEGLSDEQSKKFDEYMGRTKIWYYSVKTKDDQVIGLVETYITNAEEKNTLEKRGMSELKWDLSKNPEVDKVEGYIDTTGTFKIKINDGETNAGGEVCDFKQGKAPWNDIRGKIKKLEVEEGITRLGNYSLYYAAITQATLPSTLKNIGDGVFFGCTLLKTVTLPDALESIGYRAFCHAEGLETIALPAGITSLKGETFRDCYKLQTVTAASEIKSMKNMEFYNDPKLTTLFKISPELSEIGTDVFKVDFTGKTYETFSTWESSYNEGGYDKLIIEYYEDCEPMVKYATANATEKREFTPIEISSITIGNDNYIKKFKDSATDRIGQDIVLNIVYSDEKTRQINIEEYNKLHEDETKKIKIEFVSDEGTEEEYKKKYSITNPYFDQAINIIVELDHDWDAETGKCNGCNKVCEHNFETKDMAIVEWLRSYEYNDLRLYRNGKLQVTDANVQDIINHKHLRINPDTGEAEYGLREEHYKQNDSLNYSYGLLICPYKNGVAGNIAESTKEYFTAHGIDLSQKVAEYSSSTGGGWINADVVDEIQVEIIKDVKEHYKDYFESKGVELTNNELDAVTAITYAYGNCYVSDSTIQLILDYKAGTKTKEDVIRGFSIPLSEEGYFNPFTYGDWVDSGRADGLIKMFFEGRYICFGGEEIFPSLLDDWDGPVYESKDFIFPLYSQHDEAWKNKPFGGPNGAPEVAGGEYRRTIGTSGSGSVALAVIMSGFTGEAVTPSVMVDILDEVYPSGNYYAPGNGSLPFYYSDNENLITKYFNCVGTAPNETEEDKVEKALKDGDCVILGITANNGTQHVVTAVPVSEADEKQGYLFKVIDPTGAGMGYDGLYNSLGDLINKNGLSVKGDEYAISTVVGEAIINKGTNVNMKNLSITRIEPTCVSAGSEVKTCKICGYKETTTLEATGEHKFGEWVETKAPNCTTTGVKTRTCSDCNEKETEVIPVLGHNYQETVVAPTCTEKGYTSHECSRCHDEYKDTYVKALGHDYVDGVCSRCGIATGMTPTPTEELIVESINDKYDVAPDGENGVISKIDPQTTISKFFQNMNIEGETDITIVDAKGNEVTNTTKKIATGMKLIVENENESLTFTIVVIGDVNGDGEMNYLDLYRFAKHLAAPEGKKVLEGEYLEATDVNNDNTVGNYLDLYRMAKILAKNEE